VKNQDVHGHTGNAVSASNLKVLPKDVMYHFRHCEAESLTQ